LFRLTRAELFGLHRDVAVALAAMPDSNPERPAALANLRNIRRVRPNLAPWWAGRRSIVAIRHTSLRLGKGRRTGGDRHGTRQD
jgi:hypothetical protein